MSWLDFIYSWHNFICKVKFFWVFHMWPKAEGGTKTEIRKAADQKIIDEKLTALAKRFHSCKVIESTQPKRLRILEPKRGDEKEKEIKSYLKELIVYLKLIKIIIGEERQLEKTGKRFCKVRVLAYQFGYQIRYKIMDYLPPDNIAKSESHLPVRV